MVCCRKDGDVGYRNKNWIYDVNMDIDIGYGLWILDMDMDV